MTWPSEAVTNSESATAQQSSATSAAAQACKSCEAASRNHFSGLFNSACLMCCARLLATTRPQSPQAAAMLAVIQRDMQRKPAGFTLEQVKAAASSILTKRRCAKRN